MKQLKTIYRYYNGDTILERMDDGTMPFKGYDYYKNGEIITIDEFTMEKRLTSLAIETHYMEEDNGERINYSVCYKNNNDINKKIVESVDDRKDGMTLFEYVRDKLWD